MSEPYTVFIGGPCLDTYYDIDAWPHEGSKFNGKFRERKAGGMVANASCVMAGYGVKTYCFDSMENSADTDFLLEDIKTYGVDISHVLRSKDKKNGSCLIFQSKGERTILVQPDENSSYTADSEAIDFISGAACVYSTIPFISQMNNYPELLRELHRKGGLFALDNEPSTYVSNWRDFIRFTDVLFINDFGLKTYAEGKTESQLIRQFFDLGVSTVVETLGEKGSSIITKTGDVPVGVFEVPVVDTTGAGDTYNSSFLFAFLEGKSLEEAGLFATAAADMAITKHGSRAGVVPKAKVLEFLSKNKLKKEQ